MDNPDRTFGDCADFQVAVIDLHDVPSKGEHILKQIEKALTRLSENPQRGAYPKELLAIGLREYREVFFKPYRILYRVMAENVYVLVIADGHRDMQALLQRRLLHASPYLPFLFGSDFPDSVLEVLRVGISLPVDPETLPTLYGMACP